MATEAKINGVPAIAQGVGWRATTGVSPHQAEFSVPLDAVGGLLAAKRGETVLEMHGQTWKALSIIEPGYASDPNVGRIRVVDRRYWWSYKHHYQWINWRARVSTKRRGEWQEELQPAAVDAFKYRAFSSVNGAGKAWDPLLALKYVVTAINGKAPIIEDAKELKKLPLENLDLDMEGHEAIARCLRALPGAELTIDLEGEVRIFSWLSGAEVEVVGEGLIKIHGEAGPEIVGAGHVEKIDRANVRPKYIDVLFTPEIEVRFDFVGDDPADTEKDAGETVEKRGIPKTPRRVRNVLPLPDFKLTYKGKDYYQGTFFTVDDSINAWTDPPGILSKLSHKILRRAFIPERGLWAALGLAGTLDAKGSTANWSARVAALQAHYRQTFQIPKDWLERTFAMRPYLVGTIDVTTGQRAPAMAFSDHAIKPSEKGLYLDAATRKADKLAYAWNVTGYPGENVEIVTDTIAAKTGAEQTQPAPATIQILDEDQGVFRVAYQVDPWGRGQMVFPSKLENTPTRDWRKSTMKKKAVFFNSITKGGKVCALAETHRLAAIMTLVPATSLYRIRVKPEDVAGLLPKAVADGLGESTGPPKEIRVGPGIETARIPWSQKAAPAIEKAFGQGLAPGADVPGLTKALRPFCVNDSPGEKGAKGERGASLNQIALAHAASFYATVHDRVEGSMSAPMNADYIPTGAIDSVSHQVDGDGAPTSSISLRPTIEPIDVAAYFDASTFRIVFRRVQ